MSWANLDDEIGYVMLKSSDVEIVRQINNGNSFFTMRINHGINPTDAGYAYVVLPKSTSEDTASYSQNPDIEILCSNNSMHAVRDNTTGIIGANIFEPSSLGGLNILTPCAIIYKYDNGVYNINVSDPTLLLNTIQIEFVNDIIVNGDENITLKGKVVSINMKKHGATYSFTATEQ